MEIRNCNPQHVASAIAIINANTYDGQVTTREGINVIRSRKNGKANVRVAIRTKQGKVKGARDTWSGRSGPYACWHTFRDFSRTLFKLDPDVVIVTAFAKYTAADFEELYLSTYWKNVGSMMQPAAFGELCHNCSEGCS